MAISMKFAGFLRGLMGRADKPAPSKPATAPAPAAVSTSAPKPTPQPPKLPGNPNVIELPLAPVVAHLPLDLRAKLMSSPSPNQTIHLQAEMVIQQLAFGAVKISFGELRQLAPGVFVNSGGGLDNKLVTLPLQEILPRVNSALLARRGAKQVEVSEEITGPFSGRGRGFTFTTQPLKAPVATPAKAPESAFPSPPPRQATPPSVSPLSSSVSPLSPSVSPLSPPRAVTPAAPQHSNGNGNGNGHATPISPLSPPRSITPAPTNGSSNSNGSSQPGLRLGAMNGNGHAPAQPPVNRLASVPAPAPAPAPAPSHSAVSGPQIFVSLGDLCESWPENLKSEILPTPLAKANITLNGSLILSGLKRGRVTMTWKQLRLLAQPGSPASPNDNLELELPLKVIAPLFLAAQRNPSKAHAKATVSAEIPDLFFGFPTTSAGPAAPILPPPPKPPEPKAAEVKDTNFYVWGEESELPQADESALRRGEVPQTDFMSRQAHPKEVVQRAAKLPGVAGSVVAMQDGLCVASQVPENLNPDTLAAFLPQIYERINQSTRELRMGALNNINFTVGNVPWKIFRVNAVYFAAFGRAGEHLPSAQLAQLAGELDRKKSQ
jgi:predicted regulator of Ras-like GTPase activity (Roadblock/LC7/MglB family)